jgi:hypothetical protein
MECACYFSNSIGIKHKLTGHGSIKTRASEIPDASFAAGVTGDHGVGLIRG